MRAHQIVPAAVLLLTSSVASAGLTITYERKKAGSGETGTATMIFEPGHIRMDGMGGGGPRGGGRNTAVILDAANKKVLMLDGDKKAYREMTEADAKQMKERMDGMRAQMAERMKTMPPEQRKQAEEMMNRMGGGAPIEIKYEALGTKKKVAGYACEMYKVSVGSLSTTESCIAPWGSSLVTKAEAEQFRKSFADMEKAFGGLGPMRSNDWSKAPGIPVEQVHLGADGKPEWTTTLKSVSHGSIPAAQFQVPAGYTKEESPMGRGGGMGPGGPHGGMGPGGPHGGGPGGPHGAGGPGGPP
jgi:hypothetical protein